MAVEANVQADLDFHLAVAEASQNALLIALVHMIRDLLRETIAATFARDPLVERRKRDHGRVLEAIRQRDPQAAEAAMRAHLRTTEELFMGDASCVRATSPVSMTP